MAALAYLSHVEPRLGESLPLAEVEEVRAAGLVDQFAAEGLSETRIAVDGAPDLAAASLRATVAGIGRPDVSIYSSNTCISYAAQVARDAGLSTVPLIGLTRNGCANLVVALRVARSLLAETDIGTAAVTLLDAAGGGRLVPGGIGVLSDGAVSCLVSRERPEAGWEITGVATASELRLEGDDGSDPRRSADAAHSMGREIRSALGRLAAAAGTSPQEYEIVLMNHYTWSTLALFAKFVERGMEQLYDPTRGSVSHCFGADPLIDLAALEREHPASGTRVFTVVSAPGMWGMLTLRRV
jgi:3-oxoacyl-[acyl-carrier-protein] synthase III